MSTSLPVEKCPLEVKNNKSLYLPKKKMIAVVKRKEGRGASIEEVPLPSPGEKEVLVKVRVSSICGTDIHIYRWDRWASKTIKLPRIFGHEFAGEVVETGKRVSKIKVGDLVSCETHISCGSCYLCKTGNSHICQNLKIVGLDRDGAFAEYICLPEENLWKTHKEIPLEIATLQEPFGNAVHATLIEDVVGKNVLVTGCGPIGLMAIAVARASGASKIFASEVVEFRLNMARKMGANFLINPKRDNLYELVMDETDGLGVDVFLEMSGNGDALKDGLRSLRKGGRVSLLGIPENPVSLDISRDIVFKGCKIYGINGRKIYETWYKLEELLLENRVDLSPLLTHRFKLEEIDNAMEVLMKKEAIKVLLFPK